MLNLGLWLGLQKGGALTGGGSAPSAPTAIFLSDNEVAEGATNGTLIGTLLTAGGTAPYTYSLISDPSSLLAIDSDSLEVGDAFTGLEDYTFTVRTTDANFQTFDQEFVLTVVAAIDNDSGIGSGDGEVVVPDPEDPETDQGGFENPPVQQDTNDGLKISGKNGGSATFLKDWGVPVPGAIYTMRYTADWSLMSRLGREAAIGFAFKNGNNFHLSSLRGDGAVSTVMRESKIHGDFRKANQFTITNDGAADNGTKNGPNWLQIEISGDGTTYTLRTSADGSSWADAYTAAVPVPLDAADDALQFGPGGYFTNQDKGVFSITIEEFDEIALPINTALPEITGTAKVGRTLTCSTGTWSNANSYAYQWKSDGVVIDGATANTFVLTQDEIATEISCTVTATNADGSAQATSDATDAVLGLLDGLSPTGAWSMSRDLLAAFAGNARYTTVTGVDSLKDQSGNSRNVNQATTANQPAVTTAGPNSRTCADFDGSNDGLVGAALSNFIANNSAFMIVSGIFDAITTTHTGASIYQNNGLMGDQFGYWGIVARDADPDKAVGFNYDGSYDILEPDISTGTVYVFTLRHEGGTLYMSVNGGAEISVASGNTQQLTGALAIGRCFTVGNVKFFEGAIFSTVPGSSERAAIVADFIEHVGAA